MSNTNENEPHTLENEGAPHLRFTGRLIAKESNSPDQASGNWSGQAGRWTSLALYQTEAGKYVCHRIEHTQWDGETDGNTARVCDTVDAVQQFFGYGPLAKDLYFEADAVQEVG